MSPEELEARLEQAEARIAQLELVIVSAFGEDDPGEDPGEVTTRWRAAHEAARARRRRERGR